MCHLVQLLREILETGKLQEFMETLRENYGKKGEMILNSYEKTRKFEKAFSFTHYSDLVCGKISPREI